MNLSGQDIKVSMPVYLGIPFLCQIVLHHFPKLVIFVEFVENCLGANICLNLKFIVNHAEYVNSSFK